MDLRAATATTIAAALLLVTACADIEVVSAPHSPEAAANSSTEADVGASTGTATQFSDERVRDIDQAETMRHVWRLANRIGVRVRGTEGERRGARYIKRRFASYGYRVRIQKFEADGRTSRNVYAWWPGAIDYPVIVGAHMDTVQSSPGANDNASGVASMLEVARLIAGKRPAKFVRFVAFGSEEYGSNGEHHIGSTVFVRRLGKEGRRKLAGMVSVDMVADGRPLLVGNSGIAGDVVARALYRKINRAGIDVSYRTLCDCSDNGPFEHAGIPASFMWSGDEPNYHDDSDTVRNMKPDDLLRSARAVRIFVLALDYELIRRFRRG
ncbi:MAG: M28 family peptidase [Actinomycetota bacterium]|nr:M28 family peptidase [Actinomycetota bacterium]